MKEFNFKTLATGVMHILKYLTLMAVVVMIVYPLALVIFLAQYYIERLIFGFSLWRRGVSHLAK